jgi:ABC-type taurine transport system substrate-binding protein
MISGGGTKKIMLRIDGDKIRAEIKKTGSTVTDMAKIFDIPVGTLSAWLSRNEMPDAQLEKVCLFLRAEQKEFILPDEPKEKPGDEHAEALEDIAAALVSITQMMETMQGTVKRMSDELSTLKDTEFQASQEAKRYYQTAKSLFNKIEGWIRNGRNE